MKKIIFTLVCLLFPLMAWAGDVPDRIRHSLQEFSVTWNKGDINSVVEKYYQHSPDTLLISSAETVQGYDNVLAFFKKNYPTADEMGKITFTDIKVKPLSPQYAMAIGKWSVVRKMGQPIGGIFTVLYENTNSDWMIVVDHTSGL